ncbi:hypothetical protein FACS189445_6780 [Spirochaetia bacterium]|nr:hypothetical protein FACS189445_6780 [Spirochaetia bacterium]
MLKNKSASFIEADKDTIDEVRFIEEMENLGSKLEQIGCMVQFALDPINLDLQNENFKQIVGNIYSCRRV